MAPAPWAVRYTVSADIELDAVTGLEARCAEDRVYRGVIASSFTCVHNDPGTVTVRFVVAGETTASAEAVPDITKNDGVAFCRTLALHVARRHGNFRHCKGQRDGGGECRRTFQALYYQVARRAHRRIYDRRAHGRPDPRRRVTTENSVTKVRCVRAGARAANRQSLNS